MIIKSNSFSLGFFQQRYGIHLQSGAARNFQYGVHLASYSLTLPHNAFRSAASNPR